MALLSLDATNSQQERQSVTMISMRSCFGKRSKELLKKIFVILLYQIIGWILYTYIEEGFALTDCLFDQGNIRRLQTTNTSQVKVKLYNDLNKTLGGDLNGTIFNIYHEEFKTYFAAKEPNSASIDVSEICKRWYLFTAITLTTVGKITVLYTKAVFHTL